MLCGVYRSAVAAAAVGVFVAACTPSEASPDVHDDATPIDGPVITAPPERSSRFCIEMVALDDRLTALDAADSGDLILNTYLELADEVPTPIAEEFRAVIVSLQTPAGPTTTITTTASTTASANASTPGSAAPLSDAPDHTDFEPFEAFDGEGYLPGENPSDRVTAYVDTICRGTANNPGPPPTDPVEDITLTDDG